MKFIDVHCHLDGDWYGDMPRLMQKIRAAGVEKIIAAGCDLKTSEFSMRLSEEYDFCYFTAGLHPTELKNYREGDLEKIYALSSHPKCVAIGETGLDYHYPDADKELQRDFFIKQLVIADRAGLPVEIHSRDCAEDMLSIIKENARLLKNGALLHCYSHSPETAAEFEKFGLYFSFGGSSTRRGSKKAKRSIAAVSISRLLTETDSPYLPPESLSGVFPNTPASIPEILRNMADIRGESYENMADIVWENAHRLFKKLKN